MYSVQAISLCRVKQFLMCDCQLGFNRISLSLEFVVLVALVPNYLNVVVDSSPHENRSSIKRVARAYASMFLDNECDPDALVLKLHRAETTLGDTCGYDVLG
jgi:hypothetical protein